jgi:hypothetical protein
MTIFEWLNSIKIPDPETIFKNVISFIFNFIFNPPQSWWFNTVKFAFISFSIFLLIGIIFFLIKTSWLKSRFLQNITEFLTYRPYGSIKLKSKWMKIASRLESGVDSEYKLAVIEADSLFDEVLKNIGYKGEDLTEKLSKIKKDVLPSLDEILKSHRVRDNIVHDPSYNLTYEEARKVLEAFRKGLEELDAF